MELRWTLHALDDLDEAGQYVAADNPKAAASLARRVRESVEYLLVHPNLGRQGRLRGTREMVVSGSPFIVVYRVRGDQIQILRLLHHARNWPR